MDASYKIQRGIHVHLIQFFMCPEFWVHIIRRYALRFVYIRHSLSTFPPFSAPPAPTFLNFYFHLFWGLENRFLSCYPLIGILLCPPCRLSERSNHADTTLAAGLPLLDHCKPAGLRPDGAGQAPGPPGLLAHFGEGPVLLSRPGRFPGGDAGDVLFPPQDPPLVFSGRLPSPVSVPGAPALLSVAVAGALICLEQAVPAVRTSCPLTTGKVHTCRTSRIFSHTCRRKSRFNSLCQKVLQGPFGSL